LYAYRKKEVISRLPEFLHIRSEKADAQKKLTEEERFSDFFKFTVARLITVDLIQFINVIRF
jgi:hypothetical protein